MIDGPYKLPKGWRWVRLGEVASRPQYGYTKSATLHPIGPKFVRITDITSGEIDWSKVPYCECDTKKLEKYRLYPGDVLFARSGSVGATILIKETPYDAVFASYLIRVRFRESVLSEFANLLLKAPVCQRQLIPQGAAQKNINARLIESILVPLPPMSEQQRIVAKVEMLMEQVREARRLRQKAVEDADRLWQSVLADTFPHPGTDLPSNWRWVRLGEICEYKTGIWGPEASDPKLGFPIVRSTEIDGMFIRPEKASIREIPRSRLDAYALKSSDILVNKSSGSPRLVGWPALFEGSKDGRIYLFSNFMLRLRVKESVLMSHFLLYYLHSPIARSIYLGAQDTTSGLRNLRVRDFMNQSIPLAPFNEQQGLITHLERTHKNIKSLMDGQAQFGAELQRLEQSILDSAFKGEL